MKTCKRLAVVFVIGFVLFAALIASLGPETVAAAGSEVNTSAPAAGIDSMSLLPLEPAIQVSKTVAFDPVTCSQLSEIQVSPGANVFFCITIENSGTVTLTEHIVSDSLLGGPVPVNYTLLPGEVVSMTNATLQAMGMPAVLGPIMVEAGTLTNTVTVVSSNPAIEGAVASAAATAEVNAVPTAIDDVDEPIAPQLEPSVFVPAFWQ